MIEIVRLKVITHQDAAEALELVHKANVRATVRRSRSRHSTRLTVTARNNPEDVYKIADVFTQNGWAMVWAWREAYEMHILHLGPTPSIVFEKEMTP